MEIEEALYFYEDGENNAQGKTVDKVPPQTVETKIINKVKVVSSEENHVYHQENVFVELKNSGRTYEDKQKATEISQALH
jgi:hypothetical protein